MPAFSPVWRSAHVAARVVPFDPVAEALRPQSAHKVKKPKAFYIESVMEIRKTQYHEEFGTNNGGFCKVMMREGEMAVVKDSTQRRPSATAGADFQVAGAISTFGGDFIVLSQNPPFPYYCG
jgi:hypothetical protein